MQCNAIQCNVIQCKVKVQCCQIWKWLPAEILPAHYFKLSIFHRTFSHMIWNSRILLPSNNMEIFCSISEKSFPRHFVLSLPPAPYFLLVINCIQGIESINQEGSFLQSTKQMSERVMNWNLCKHKVMLFGATLSFEILAITITILLIWSDILHCHDRCPLCRRFESMTWATDNDLIMMISRSLPFVQSDRSF